MERWIEASILDGFADGVIVPDIPNPKAFVAFKYHRDKWDKWGLRLAQPTLVAVGQEARGLNIRLLSETLYHLRDNGVEHIYGTTQNTNRVAIHVLEKLGFVYGRGEYVFRIIL